MKFAYTILYVPDVTAAAEFYAQCFGLRVRFIHDSGQYAELETAGVTLAFTSEELARQNVGDAFTLRRPGEKAPGVEIAFMIDNVQQAYDEAVKNGAASVAKPSQKPWGQTVAYVTDLNGFLVELCSPMG